jgi:hypothetical protein
MKKATTLAAVAAALLGCSGTFGGKTRDALRTGLTDKQADLQACYAQALARNREAAGRVEVALHVTHGQKTVSQVDVPQSAIQDPEMQACVQTALRGVTIAEAPRQNVRAHFYLEFQPSAAAPAAEPAGTAAPGETAAPEASQ